MKAVSPVRKNRKTEFSHKSRFDRLTAPSKVEVQISNGVSETSRAKWWEWFAVGVLFATAIVCAHIA
jgi:hypothetical protein